MENNDLIYRDIFDEDSIRIVKKDNGMYKWVIESDREFRSPFAALADAVKVQDGPREEFESPDTDEIDLPWPKVVVRTETEIDWTPLVQLREP